MEETKAVITTKSIVQKNNPILLIICDEDGDYQFLDGKDVNTKEVMVLSLNQIIQIDLLIKDVVKELLPNSWASRNSIIDKWKIQYNNG